MFVAACHVEESGAQGSRPLRATLPKLLSAEANASRASAETLKVRCLKDRLSNHTDDFCLHAELCYYERFVKSVHLLARTPYATCNEV